MKNEYHQNVTIEFESKGVFKVPAHIYICIKFNTSTYVGYDFKIECSRNKSVAIKIKWEIKGVSFSTNG